MKGLLLNQILTMRKAIVLYAVILILYYLFGIFGKGLAGIVIFAGFFSFMLVINSFSYEEKCGWDAYVNVLPVTKFQIVLSKYVLAVLVLGAAVGAGTVLQIFINVKNHVEIGNDLWIPAAVFLGASVFLSAAIPILYKLGAEKGRIIMAGFFLILFFLVLLAEKAEIGISLGGNGIKMVLPFLAAGVFVFMILSCFLSLKIYEGKEF